MKFSRMAMSCAAVALLSGLAEAGPVFLSYEVSPVLLNDGSAAGSDGDRVYRYTYHLSGGLLANEELSIEFDALRYGRLSRAVAPASLDVLLFQPNNPEGTAGLLSALALEAIAGPATLLVDVTYLGDGVPGNQPYAVSTFNSNGEVIELQSGASVSNGQTPEPATLVSAGAALIALAGARLRRTRSRLSGLASGNGHCA